MEHWIENHFNQLRDLQLNAGITDGLANKISMANGVSDLVRKIRAMQEVHGRIIFIGNGGSAGICSHLANDFSKNGHIPAIAFSDAAALTCISNDFGYEYVFAKQIEFHARKGDILVAISSSGQSPNIIKAVNAARALELLVITYSGFSSNNALRHLGDINFYIESSDYGLVEVSHLALAHMVLDYIIETNTKEKIKHTDNLTLA